jgi:hypothetical protein
MSDIINRWTYYINQDMDVNVDIDMILQCVAQTDADPAWFHQRRFYQIHILRMTIVKSVQGIFSLEVIGI